MLLQALEDRLLHTNDQLEAFNRVAVYWALSKDGRLQDQTDGALSAVQGAFLTTLNWPMGDSGCDWLLRTLAPGPPSVCDTVYRYQRHLLYLFASSRVRAIPIAQRLSKVAQTVRNLQGVPVHKHFATLRALSPTEPADVMEIAELTDALEDVQALSDAVERARQTGQYEPWLSQALPPLGRLHHHFARLLVDRQPSSNTDSATGNSN